MFYLLNPFFGRIGRGKWWLLQIVIFAIMVALMVGAVITQPNITSIAFGETTRGQLWMLFIIVVSLYLNCCSCINRLRDTGRIALVYLTFFLPFIGTGLMIYFCGIEKGGSVIKDDQFGTEMSGRNEPSAHSFLNRLSARSEAPTVPKVQAKVRKTVTVNGRERPVFGRL